jgi:hypothetical protein
MPQAMDHLEKGKKGDTVMIDGDEVPVQNLYKGAGLEQLIIKAEITSKSPLIQQALNRLATIWLHVVVTDSYFAMWQKGKKTFTEQIAKMMLEHSLAAPICG